MTDFSEILKYWAADREGVSAFGITTVEYKFDSGWVGTDVTPGDPPEFVFNYTVTRDVVHRVPVDEMGKFIVELAEVARRGPFPHSGGESSE